MGSTDATRGSGPPITTGADPTLGSGTVGESRGTLGGGVGFGPGLGCTPITGPHPERATEATTRASPKLPRRPGTRSSRGAAFVVGPDLHIGGKGSPLFWPQDVEPGLKPGPALGPMPGLKPGLKPDPRSPGLQMIVRGFPGDGHVMWVGFPQPP